MPVAMSYLQVGAFSDMDNAERMATRMRVEGFPQVAVKTAVVRGQEIHRVLTGPYLKDDDRDAARRVLSSRGYDTFVIRDTLTP